MYLQLEKVVQMHIVTGKEKAFHNKQKLVNTATGDFPNPVRALMFIRMWSPSGKLSIVPNCLALTLS